MEMGVFIVSMLLSRACWHLMDKKKLCHNKFMDWN